MGFALICHMVFDCIMFRSIEHYFIFPVVYLVSLVAAFNPEPDNQLELQNSWIACRGSVVPQSMDGVGGEALFGIV